MSRCVCWWLVLVELYIGLEDRAMRERDREREAMSIVRFESGKKVTFWNPPPPCGDLVA